MDTNLQSSLSLTLSSPLMETIRQTQETMQRVFDVYIEPMQRALKAFQEHMQKIAEAVKRFVENFVKPLLYAFSWKPLIYVVPPTKQDQCIGRHLTMEVNPHGFFVFGGKTLFKLHSSESRCGRLLFKLLLRRSEIVEYEDIKEHIGSGDMQKAFKDLKYKLKCEGYELRYTLVHRKGIALEGIVKIQ